jgi:hypothetical protein
MEHHFFSSEDHLCMLLVVIFLVFLFGCEEVETSEETCDKNYSQYHKDHIERKNIKRPPCPLRSMKEIYFLRDGHMYSDIHVKRMSRYAYWIHSQSHFGEYKPIDQYSWTLFGFYMGWVVDSNSEYLLLFKTATYKRFFVFAFDHLQYNLTEEIVEFAHMLREENIAFADTGKETFLFDVAKRRRICNFPSTHLYREVKASALSPNNKLRAMITYSRINGKNIHIIDISSGKIVKQINIPYFGGDISFIDNNTLLLEDRLKEGFYLWNFEKDEASFYDTGTLSKIHPLRDGKLLVLHHHDVSILDPTTKVFEDKLSLGVDKPATSIYTDEYSLIIGYYGALGISFLECPSE